MGGFRKKRDDGPGAPGAAGPPPNPYPDPAHRQPPPGPGYPHDPYGAPGTGPGPGGPGPAYGGPGPGPGYGGEPPYGGGTGPTLPGAVSYGPRLPWKALLSGIVFRPSPTFWQMRDHPMWAPALIVTFLYGLVAVFGLDEARRTILDTTAGSVAPYLLVTGVAMVLGTLALSTVTHTLARQFGGNGHWAPTAGLAMLIMTLTDVPRLALAIFLGGAHPLVQLVGWLTWLYAGALFTMMVGRSHEIPWQKALGASGIQLLGLLVLVKLGTL